MFTAISLIASLIASMSYLSGLRVSFMSDGYVFAKMLASSVFLIVGIIAVIISKKRAPYTWLVLGGLVCGWAGDLLLALSVSRPGVLFIAGMGVFLLNHLLFVAALYTVSGFRMRDVYITAGIFAFMLLLTFLGKADFGGMDVAIYVYMLTLSFLAGKAISAFSLRALPDGCSLLMLIGVLLWATSDVLLCVNAYMKPMTALPALLPFLRYASNPSEAINIFNGITYFTGQTLAACSVYYFGKGGKGAKITD